MDNGVEPKWPRCKCGGAAVTNASGDLTRTCIRCGKIVRKDSSVEPIRGDSMDNGVENVSDLRAALAVKTELLDEMAGIADKLQVELAVMREELDTLRHEKEFLIENNVKSMTLSRDELALRTQERDALQGEHDSIATTLKHCGYGTIDEMLPRFRESWALQKVMAILTAERDALAKALKACVDDLQIAEDEICEFSPGLKAGKIALDALTDRSKP